MRFSILRNGCWAVLAIGVVAFAGCSALGNRSAQPARTPWTYVVPQSTPSISLPTEGVAPAAPIPILTSPLASSQERYYRALAERARPCKYAQAHLLMHDDLYIGCSQGTLVALDRSKRVIASIDARMDGINSIDSAGGGAIVVSGFNDGASLRNDVSLFRARTLRPIKSLMSDSTFLGVIGDRAYIDNWCCFGRPDVYQPATIYSISLKNGDESIHLELAPDPRAHPPDQQPLGQGDKNFLIGKYFYVVVGSVTYRYDIFHLQKQPKRMATAGTAGP